jgi:hypothetical protein
VDYGRQNRRAAIFAKEPMNQVYVPTVQLLLKVAPLLFESRFFALKGGTALNLFIQDLPRMSVDIDVVFTDHEVDRDTALATIKGELAKAKGRMERLGLDAVVRSSKTGDETKMFVRDGGLEVKVEVNFVLRGTVLPVARAALTPAAQQMFAANIEVPMLAPEEVYGGKLVAAMDRQHPRDLFDVMLMRQRFGLPAPFVDCFVAYLAGHNRTMHEVLFPGPKPIARVYASEFVGMTTAPVALADLEATRVWLFDALPKALTKDHREFLLSLLRGEPAWPLMPFAHLKDLPAIRWKQLNLAKFSRGRPALAAQQYEELATHFASLND